MATTTNYGWETPDDTDLVKDGAAAIRTLGSAIDTTMATMVPKSLVDAKGDLFTATADDTPARLAVGANDTILVADSSTATGLKWATPAASASGLTLISSTTISNATSASINNCFSATYDSYLVVISLDAGGNGADYPYIRVRVGGTDLSSGTYAKQRITLNGATTSSASTTADTEVTSVMFSDNTAGTSSYCLATFINPFATKPTFLNYNTTSYNGTGTSSVYYATGIVKNTTSYDGFSLINANTMNGRIRVYGYQNS